MSISSAFLFRILTTAGQLNKQTFSYLAAFGMVVHNSDETNQLQLDSLDLTDPAVEPGQAQRVLGQRVSCLEGGSALPSKLHHTESHQLLHHRQGFETGD